MSRMFGIGSLGLLLVVGCVDPDLGGLDKQLDGFKRQAAAPLVTLPVEIAHQVYIAPRYDHADSRSPFHPHRLEVPSTLPQERVVDAMRQREPLEHYDLSELRLVGTLMVGAQPSALLRSPEGRVHRLAVDSYLGSNAGRVVSIHGGVIVVEEHVREGSDWVTHRKEMRLHD